MLIEYVNQANEELKSFGYEIELKGATDEQIKFISDKAKKELDCNLPEDYLSFLRITNGFNFNGRFIYGFNNTTFNNEKKSQI